MHNYPMDSLKMYYNEHVHKYFKDASKMMMGLITVRMPFKCII